MLEVIQQRKVYNTDTHRNIISEVFVNGKFFVYVLEDEVRSDGVKIDGMTCIGAGEYDVILTMSNHFKRVMPLIYNMPDFTINTHGKRFAGIRAHGLNDETGTEGCLGVCHHTNGITVWGSAEKEVTQLIKDNGGHIKWIIQDKIAVNGLDGKLLD